MTRVSIAVDFRSARSPASPNKTLAPTLSCALRAQPSPGGLCGASGLPLLAGLLMGRSSLLAGGL
ncbi:MAG TPA: hypothetical protein VGS04_00425 [Nitrososphaerales archaeon]|nr:hypothetical protein [Nitrososphaerales archaeon]